MNLEQKRRAALQLAGIIDTVAKSRDRFRVFTLALLSAAEKVEDFLTEVEKQGTETLEKLALDIAAEQDKGNPVADVWTNVVKPGSVVDFSNGPVQVDDESRVMPDGIVQLFYNGIWYDKDIMIEEVIKYYGMPDTDERKVMLAGMPNSALINAFSITQERGDDDGSAGMRINA